MKHLLPATVLAITGTLAAAVAVDWCPSLPGKVITGAGLAVVAAWWLGKHRHARRGAEAGLAGAVLATALIALLPAAVPAVVGLVMIAPAAAHELNPKRRRPVRTTRGVRTAAGKAAGGRPGRPGEAAHKPRATRPASSRTPVRPRPAPRAPASWEPAGWRAPAVPGPELSWPHKAALSRIDLLPWAGSGAPSWPGQDEPEIPRRVRRDADRPSGVHRKACGDCAAGSCQPGPCPAKGCECAAPAHDIPPF